MRSLHSSGRRQIVNNAHNKKVNYKVCYKKNNKTREIKSTWEWRIVAILNSIVKVNLLEKVTPSRLKGDEGGNCNYEGEKCTRYTFQLVQRSSDKLRPGVFS